MCNTNKNYLTSEYFAKALIRCGATAAFAAAILHTGVAFALTVEAGPDQAYSASNTDVTLTGSNLPETDESVTQESW